MKKTLIIVLAVVLVAVAALVWVFVIPHETPRYFYSTGDAYITNVLDSESLIKTSMTLETSRDETDTLTAQNSAIRDCILNILRNQTEEVYKSGDMQEVISNQIINSLNQLFPAQEGESPLFLAVYFNDFVLQ